MQKIYIKFNEYKLPENPNWLDKSAIVFAEFFNAPGFRNEVSFSLSVKNPELFLAKGKKFSVEGTLIGRNKSTNLKISDWKYKAITEDNLQIEVKAEEIKPSLAERQYRKLSDEYQTLIPIILFSIVLCSPLFVYGLLMDFPEPLIFWNFIGNYIRSFILISLFIAILFVLIWNLVKFKQSALKGSFTGVIGGFLFLAIPMIWWLISFPPESIVGNPNEGSLYLSYLFGKIYLVFGALLGITPWVLLILKYFGLDLAASIFSLISKSKEEK